ncbi:hypothetical protein K4F52_004229 [Lecanicillium sp. MT-2017a]|nr:hypothetical protein K4F52_004229 [Lecanicillium sp. MT-2017a]
MLLARQAAGDSTPMFGSGQFSTDWPGFQFQVNSTNTVINQLRLATSKSIRQSAIILASFNAVAAIGIMVQGTIFAIEQSKGLDSLLILGCEPISQVMLPGRPDTILCQSHV